MATAAQVIANRANALHSTGPRTLEGQQASSANGVTTGLTAAKLFVRPDEQADFDVFETGVRSELQPEGVVESLLFDRILHASWNLRRCDALEYKIQQQAFAQNLDDAIQNEDLARQLDRVYRYKRMHQSSYRHAMAALRQLQTEQIRRRENQEFMEESILIDTTKVLDALSRNNARESKAFAKRAEARVIDFIKSPPPTHR